MTKYRQGYKLVITLLIVFSAFVLNSCSLLKFSIESDNTPLEQDKLRTRMDVQNFGIVFFHKVMAASDSIISKEKDKQIQLNALTWKINASQAAKNTIFQSIPEIALLDTWILTASMNDFLENGAGSDLFGNSQQIAVETSKTLLSKIDTIAHKAFSKEYKYAKAFVDSICTNYPFSSLQFYRETVYDDWFRYRNVPDSLIDVNTGTLPQVLSDLSARATIIPEQTLRETQWAGERMLKASDIDSLDILKMSEDFNKQFERLIVVLSKSGRIMQQDAVVIHNDFIAFSKNLNKNFDSIMVVAKQEMQYLRDSLSVQREALMADFDKTSNKLVKTALEELHLIIKDILFYLLLILIAILFIPFALGYITGKTLAKKKKDE